MYDSKGKPGRPAWVPPPYSELSALFFRFKCRITDAAQALGIARDTLNEYVKNDPYVKGVFKEVQKSLDNEWLDQAEKVLWFTVANVQSKPGHALKAATYILDNKGKERGWQPQNTTVSPNDELLDLSISNFKKPENQVIPDAVEPETIDELPAS